MQEATPLSHDGEFDVLAERFFSEPPAAWESAHASAHDDWQPQPMSSIERVAMMTTVAPAMAMLAVAVTLLSLPAANGDTAIRRDSAKTVALSAPAPVAAPVPAPIAQPQSAIAQPVVSVPRPATAPQPRRARKQDAGAKRARQLLDAGDARAARDAARDVVRGAPARAEGYIVLAAALDKLGDRAGMNATFGECARLATDPLASACKSLARQR